MRFTVHKYSDKFEVIDSQIKEEEQVIVICDREAQAKVIVDKLNEMQQEIEEKPLNLHENFNEWETHISELDSNENRLIQLKEELIKLQLEEDRNTDYKGLYGKNNSTIRELHYKEVFSEIYEGIYNLERDIKNRERKLSFVRELIRMKIALLKINEGVEL